MIGSIKNISQDLFEVNDHIVWIPNWKRYPPIPKEATIKEIKGTRVKIEIHNEQTYEHKWVSKNRIIKFSEFIQPTQEQDNNLKGKTNV